MGKQRSFLKEISKCLTLQALSMISGKSFAKSAALDGNFLLLNQPLIKFAAFGND